MWEVKNTRTILRKKGNVGMIFNPMTGPKGKISASQNATLICL
ncbi:MAG: hypothetical protein ACXAEU_25775 [Candidatus Hodarchaeales archaeon]|jgi:hypothetical protein